MAGDRQRLVVEQRRRCIVSRRGCFAAGWWLTLALPALLATAAAAAQTLKPRPAAVPAPARALSPPAVRASTVVEVPAGSVLAVQLEHPAAMRVGQPLVCRLLYPVYAGNRLEIPAGSVVRGRVTALRADGKRRVRARLGGDFTPFHTAVVTFNKLTLPDGRTAAIDTSAATNGAQVLHLEPPAPRTRHAYLREQVVLARETAWARAKSAVAAVTAPGLGGRLLQLLYSQLPYHPQRIAKDTAWTATLTRPVTLAQPVKHFRRCSASHPGRKQRGQDGAPKSLCISLENAVVREQQPGQRPKPQEADPAASGVKAAAVWHIYAYLEQTISSATDKRGDTFRAVVAEPVFNASHHLVIPQGSTLVGTITEAKPARWLGRPGRLRFDFRKLELAGSGAGAGVGPAAHGNSRHVQGTLAGVEAASAQQLSIDAEGGVQSSPKNRVIVPLVLTLLAGRTLSDDGSAQGNAAVGANGFGLMGRMIGIASGSKNVAAVIGFYSAGLAFTERWIVHGANVTFPADTRIDVTTVPTLAPLPVAAP